uniref:Replication protein A subunit n=1 Tax=Chromera velia CCMP2878 TaxID=1169474 RepID=A0A0G4FV06_9ALVE|eukprot:Cvel_18913.t1-p1 / transcript=Cvel_18913.t1 / gene=Cvel_18913 / organism=Chromera_velia_CCMP2878 / gene_product=Replication factor A protein 1, putative / transcript_product=Replication factor A protein 1, putative / location=Cvel_scaffold1594:5129-11988(+) / protein_length=631 / sequence_SO=supercontig / SO=protein_coding / is_pseudo=false
MSQAAPAAAPQQQQQQQPISQQQAEMPQGHARQAPPLQHPHYANGMQQQQQQSMMQGGGPARQQPHGYGQGPPGGNPPNFQMHQQGLMGGPSGGYGGGGQRAGGFPNRPPPMQGPGAGFGTQGPGRAGGSFGGPVQRQGDAMFMPIKDLTEYQQRWVVKARVSEKRDKKQFTNQRGEGKLFSVDLCDSSGEIRATFFGKSVDEYFDRIEVGRVYIFTRGTIKAANQKYNTTTHRCEITFSHDAKVEEVPDDVQIPTRRFVFKKISDLASMEVGSVVDILAGVQEAGPISVIQVRSTMQDKDKRNLTLVDNSGHSGATIELTLWGDTCRKFSEDIFQSHPVLAIKGLKLGEFNGRSLNSLNSSSFELVDERTERGIEGAANFRNWWENRDPRNVPQQKLSGSGSGGSGPAERRELKEIIDLVQNRQAQDQQDMSQLLAHVTYIPTRRGGAEGNLPLYLACLKCRKKVEEIATGQYNCMTCGGNVQAERKWILTARIADCTEQLYVSLFNEQAKTLMLDRSADEYAQACQDDADLSQGMMTEAAHRMWLFKIKSKQETYQEQVREKHTVVHIEKPDYVREGQSMKEAVLRALGRERGGAAAAAGGGRGGPDALYHGGAPGGVAGAGGFGGYGR